MDMKQLLKNELKLLIYIDGVIYMYI